MAKRFTRNIRSIENIEKQPKYTNEQNDLLSDDKHIYIRNKDKYENLTNSVKEVNGETPDSDGSVEIDTGAMTVNDEKPDKKGNVTIDTGTMTVNEETPDDRGNVEIDTGVMQVNGKDPDEQGNIKVDISDKNYLLDSKKRVLEAKTSGDPSDNANYAAYFLSEPTQAGVELTVSGGIEITDGDFDTIAINFRDENNESVGDSFLYEDHSGGEFSVTFTLSQTAYRMNIYAGKYGETRGNGVIYESVKLQPGSIATPWTPNPSEIMTQKQYDKLANAITNLGGEI